MCFSTKTINVIGLGYGIVSDFIEKNRSTLCLAFSITALFKCVKLIHTGHHNRNYYCEWVIIYINPLTHICVCELAHHWFRQRLDACSAPIHHLNQSWLIDNWTSRNNIQLLLSQDTPMFYCEMAFENIVCKMGTILFCLCGNWILHAMLLVSRVVTVYTGTLERP